MTFYADVIQKSPLFRSPNRVSDLAMLEPVTRNAIAALIAEAASTGVRLRVTETYRSSELQSELYHRGLSQLETVGVHHYGLAADFVRLNADGSADWASKDYAFLAALAPKHGLISGINWGEPNVAHSFVDTDHCQRVRVADQARLFSGAWYPDAAYNPNA